MTNTQMLRLACVAVAIGTAGSIAFVYVQYLSRSEWPPGHPWAAITMLYVSIMNVLFRAKNQFYFALKVALCLLIAVTIVYAVSIGLRQI